MDTPDAITDLWADALWRASWQGGVALAVVWCVCRFVPRITPAFKMWLWRLAWLKLLLAFFWNGSIDLALLAPDEREPAATPAVWVQSVVSVPQPDVSDTVNETSISVTRVLFMAWIAAVLFGAARLGQQWRESILLKRNASPVSSAVLDELCALLKIREPPALRQSRAVRAPMLIGILKPTVIIPSNADSDALRMMLAHELAHLKRRDLLWAWLPAICHTVFFFHPLLWLTRREWLLAQETACDRLALRASAASPAAYGNMLIDLLAARVPKPQFGALGICENIQNLKRRIMAMKTIGHRKSHWLMAALLVANLAGILPWRVVAQDKPEDAAKRIQQLERENADLRVELERARQTAGARKPINEDLQIQAAARVPLAANVIAWEAELAALRAEYAREHPKVVAAEARLKRLKELQAIEMSRATASRERSAQERELYAEELALTQKHVDYMRKQTEAGRATQDDLFRAQKQLFALKRELANVDKSQAQLRQFVQEEIAIVERQIKEANKLSEQGLAPQGNDLNLRRELLKLKRELLTLEE